ncbi:hypothetical protein C8Q74DRAFT_1371200 [Fomes fomentarius]|nr:hypothetical protein C8Q74DRAFT_1371200 [Fomes fomentarius]
MESSSRASSTKGFFLAAPRAPFLDALAALQVALLPPEQERMALCRGRRVAPKNALEDGRKAVEELRGPRFARLVRYPGRSYVKEQPSFKATWDEAVQVGMWL